MHNSTSERMSSSIAIISGGTATNELVSVFQTLPGPKSYILPILDNGGLTSELIRVIGGPAIGDIRSRLTRLIDLSDPTLRRLHDLLSYRLPQDPDAAKLQWLLIVDGSHSCWQNIPAPTKEIFRSFFIHVHTELLKRTRSNSELVSPGSSRHFRYQLANVGNMFLTGARLFTGSLESAIELCARLTAIDPLTQVLPCLNTNFTYHISALLQDGQIITGQSQISHPATKHSRKDSVVGPNDLSLWPHKQQQQQQSDHLELDVGVGRGLETFNSPFRDQSHPDSLSVVSTNLTPSRLRTSTSEIHVGAMDDSPSSPSSESDSDHEELGNIPQYTHRALRKSQLHFSKGAIQPLVSPIERIFYVSPYGQEVCPTASKKVITTISKSSVIVYSIGSLMTSIVPVIVLKGVGQAIATGVASCKILLLNGGADRETFGMSAIGYVRKVVELATYSTCPSAHLPDGDWTSYVTHIFHMKDSKIRVDSKTLLEKHGVQSIEVARKGDSDTFDIEDLRLKIRNLMEKFKR